MQATPVAQRGHELVRDRSTPDFGRLAEDLEFTLRLCLLQYIYGDSDRLVIENAKMNLSYKYVISMSIDEEPPDDTIVSYFRAIRLGEDKPALREFEWVQIYI